MKRFKVLVTDPLSDQGLGILKQNEAIEVEEFIGKTEDEIIEKIGDFHALLIRSGTTVTARILEHAKKLKVIGRAGVGVDNVDVKEAVRRGVIVMNTPTGNTLATAELTVSLVLAASRQIPQAHMSIHKGRWDRKKFVGQELYGKNIGIIGFGRIGKEVAKRLLSFGTTITIYDPFATEEDVQSIGCHYAENLDVIYSQSDYISVHVPLTDKTQYLINKEAIAKMKKGVILLNVARGGILNEEDVLEGLKQGKIGGCALDVYEKEPFEKEAFLEFENVILTPHLGASTSEAQENVAIDVAKQVLDCLLNDEVRNAVNFKNASPEILYKTAPYMVLSEKIGQLAALFALPQITHIEMAIVGELAKLPCHHLMPFFAKGFLKNQYSYEVNEVNAPFFMKEKGIRTKVSMSEDDDVYSQAIIYTLKSGDETAFSIVGTLYDKEYRIVRIDDFSVDIIPQGQTLFCRNKDIPGFVGELGSILGENNINIADLTIGRSRKGDDALTVLNVDGKIEESILKKICDLDKVRDAFLVYFSEDK